MVTGHGKRAAIFRGLLAGGVALMAWGISGRASASVIATDDFNSYAAGAVSGDNGGGGWGGAWSGANLITAGSGNSIGMPSSGNYMTAPGGTAAASFRALSGTHGNGVESDLWIGFDANLSSTAANNAWAGLSLFSGTGSTGERLFMGRLYNSSPANWAFTQDRNSSGTTITSNLANGPAINTSATAYVVVNLHFDTATPANDAATIYVNPTGPTPTGGASHTIVPFTFDNVRVASGNGTGATEQLNVDELKLGTSYADVAVPEPGMVGVLALGAAGLLSVPRRRSGTVAK